MLKLRPVSLAALCILSSALVFGQAVNGRIDGSIKDTAGAIVPGATLVIENTATGITRTAQGSNDGAFSFAEVAPGTYALRVEAQGFKKVLEPRVIVEVGTTASVNITLEVGAVSEEVTVVASEAQQIVNTANAQIGDVVDRRRILDLPLDGRNPLDLATLQAGFDDTGRVNGERARALNVTVNGINASDNFNKSERSLLTGPAIPVTVESVGEFQVTTELATAEYGRGGAQVNAITASGTNRFRGSLFYFHRNTALNANSFFNNRDGLPRNILLRNQFGGRFGGPVILPHYNGRSRTFFFFAYEGTRLAAAETRNRLVYTAEARTGNFRYLNGLPVTPANVAANPSAIRSVNLLTLKASRNTIDPTTAAQLARTQLPNNYDIGDGLNTGGFRFNAFRGAPRDIYSFRGDHHFSDKYSLEFNHSYGNDFQIGDLTNNRLQQFPDEVGVDRKLRGRSISTAFVAAFSPKLVNEFRFGFQNSELAFTNSYFGASPAFLTLSTIDNPFQTRTPTAHIAPVYQYIDNLTWTHGTHIFKTGVDLRHVTGRIYDFVGTMPSADFSATTNNPGLAAANFPGISTSTANPASVSFASSLLNNLNGAVGSITQTFNAASRTSGLVPGEPYRREYRTSEYDVYAQDTWRPRRNLTLNLGLRYEYTTVPREQNGLVTLPVGGKQGIFGPTATENLFVPGGTLGPRTTIDLTTPGSLFFKADKNNFSPVLSFAYSPWNSSKTSIRGGYRLSYIREDFDFFDNIVSINPGLFATNTVTVNNFLKNGLPTVPPPTLTLPVSAQTLFQQSSTTDVAGFNPDLRTPYTQEFTLSFQREIARDTALEIRYVGNKSHNLIRVTDINEVNVFARDSVTGQSFLEAFLMARNNLVLSRAAGKGDNFAFNATVAGSQHVPLFERIFVGAGAASTSNATFVAAVSSGEAGELGDLISRQLVGGIRGGLLFNSGLPINFFRPNPDVRAAFYADNGTRATYSALQVEVRRRFARGLGLQANYTFGKELSDFTGSTNNSRSFIDLRNPGYDYQSQSPYHQFKGNAIYEVPFGKGRQYFNKGVLSQLLGGFQLGTILRLRSGEPLTIVSGLGTLNSRARSSSATVNGLNNTVELVGISIDQLRAQLGPRTLNGRIYYIDPAMLTNFANPAPGTLGSLPHGALTGPHFFRADFSVLKRTRLTEHQNIEFRAEFFNLFNTVNLENPNLNINDPNFGVITAIRAEPRVIQFALRYNF
jgi:Carboxypeptidase regulatory-like domain/TonB dependent receptor-like, beta-barrel